MQTTHEPNVQEILNLMRHPSEEDVALIKKAYEFAKKAHGDTKRFSGEPYFTHVFETAKNLAIFGMDPRSVAAGLLHDTIEDGHVTADELKKEFDEEILFLVEGVTKLGKLKYRGLERHAESLRKLFVATAKDARVIIIKLADRLHNIKTLGGHPEKEKRERIAFETLEIFAPLADRLGMGVLKGELEDYAFMYAYPEDYKKVTGLMIRRRDEHMKYLEKFHRSLQVELALQGIKDVKIGHRVKHLYSLYKKLQRKNMDISEIYDVTALRVITKTVGECYQILGIIHSIWKPLPGRIKDYIALPKPNGYQSIHTTVFTGDGGIVEVQIRTEEMHRDAEYGVASHLAYKSGYFDKMSAPNDNPMLRKKLGWIEELMTWQENVSGNKEFLKELKMNFFKNRVFVFTPKGDTIELPEDSTPIDFAFLIHSDVGYHVAGARINYKMVSLDTTLKNGDIVEILTRKNAQPTQKWIGYAKTSAAQRHIRAWLIKNKKYEGDES
jgi:GTP pyrophosphokinase